ncbi:hypothetical protein Tco_0026092 [Tanacetum coccineum]
MVDRRSGGGRRCDGARTVITPRGTTQVVTRGILMIGVRGTVQVYEVVSTMKDLDGHVAGNDWWIGTYCSWQQLASRMLLYVKGKEHGKLLVDSVFNEPFQYRTIVKPGNETTQATVRARTYTDLTDEEKIRESVDIKTDDLDAFDSDCDDAPSAKAVLITKLSSYDSDVLSEVPFYDTNIEYDMSYQSVQETPCFEQPLTMTQNDITSDSNIISYEQYLQETDIPVVQSTSSSAQQDELLMSVIEEMSSQVAKCIKVQQENLIVIVGRNEKVADFEKQIHSLKLQLNATVESHKTLSTTVECLKKESKDKEDKYLDEFIDLQKKNKALDNMVYKIGAFEKDVKPFAQTLKEYFQMFEHGLYKELKDMKVVFNQMETEVAKCSVDKKYFEIEKKELSLDNNRLLEHIICQDIMNTILKVNDHYDNVLPANNNSLEHDNYASELLKHENDCLRELLISQDLVHTAVKSLASINDYKNMQQSFVDEYNETLVLKAELAKKHDMIENVVYNELSKRYAPEFKEIFIINELQSQLKAKNVLIEKLKEYIANIKGKNMVKSVQHVHNLNVVTLKVYKLDLQPLSPLVKHNRDVVAVVVRDFYKKFYNSLGSVPNHCSVV